MTELWKHCSPLIHGIRFGKWLADYSWVIMVFVVKFVPMVMPKPSILRPSLAYLLILSLFCVVAASSAENPKVKEPAPRFNATTTAGERFNNDSIKGKVVLLEFWTTWCGYCLQEAPLVDQLNDEF